MALGFVNFQAGNVLTEAQVDGIMRQTTMIFSSTSARDTALSGVLEEGLRAYTTDENRDWVYDGSAWICLSSPWTDYTPSLANVTLGNGSLAFRYRRSGYKTVHVKGRLLFGSTTSVTGSPIGFGYPDGVTGRQTVPSNKGTAQLVDDSNGANDQAGGGLLIGSSIFVYTWTLTATSSTVPYTWTTDDTITIDIEFEIN